MTKQTIVITIIRIIAAISVVTAAFMLAAQLANAWEGDDGGLDQREVDVGRWVHHENVELWVATEQANIDAYRDAAAAYAEAVRVNNQAQLTTPPSDPGRPPHYDSWIRIAQCESGGNWAIDTGNSFYGGLQFTLQSWRGVGMSGYPHQHSMLDQMWAAERLLDMQGWGAWPHCQRYR